MMSKKQVSPSPGAGGLGRTGRGGRGVRAAHAAAPVSGHAVPNSV
jgi:hypothetical protein